MHCFANGSMEKHRTDIEELHLVKTVSDVNPKTDSDFPSVSTLTLSIIGHKHSVTPILQELDHILTFGTGKTSR